MIELKTVEPDQPMNGAEPKESCGVAGYTPDIIARLTRFDLEMPDRIKIVLGSNTYGHTP
jgi:hypothetical protein